MIESVQGDIVHAETEAVVNPVNCVGVMGKGLALQFRQAYPDNYRRYKKVCKQGGLHPGIMMTFERDEVDRPRYIINFPTKIHFKSASRMEYIDLGLVGLIIEVRRLELNSIAIPPLGCGLGGLDWAEVKPRIETAFQPLPGVRVLLYETLV